ncbi:MAG: alkaline phosphatase family protein, partial [bacterium]
TIYPSELAEEIGENVGPMVDFPDNWPAQLNNYPEEKHTFMSELRMALDWHRRLVPYLFKKQKPDVIIQDTYAPNQMLESRWWLPYLDEKRDRYKSADSRARESAWSDIHEMYGGLDAILGEAIKNAGPDTLIVFSSDHGIIPLNKYVLLNNLFAKEGLLKFTVDEKTGEPVIDWANTKVIHLKMHGIYINPAGLAGNWRRGSGREYDVLRKKVRKMLLGLNDGDVCPFNDIIRWEDAGRLRLPKDRVADLILVMRPGYGLNEELNAELTTFKEAVAGGYKQALVADGNPGLWTPFVIMGPGVKKNHKIKSPLKNADQLPTLLKLMDIRIPQYMQGHVADEIFDK